jgi:hypothetical protein
MIEIFAFWLVLVAVLMVCVCVSIRRRHRLMLRAEEDRLRVIEQEHPRSAFDAAAIAPAIGSVRQEKWTPKFGQ